MAASEHRDLQVTEAALLREVPGGQDLLDWFGYPPAFHDAWLEDIVLSSRGESTIVLHAFRITSEVDARGYLVLDKHVEVTIGLRGVRDVRLRHFGDGADVFHLEISQDGDDYALEWDSSMGVEGRIVAKSVRFRLRAGDHRPARPGPRS